MTIDLYYAPGSPPCRTVLLTAKMLGVELNMKKIDLMKGENITPEFIKINPQHTVPTIVDDGFILAESRAIVTYLASKYGKDESLYPKDLKKRAIVDQMLHFDAGSLFQKFADHYFPIFMTGAAPDPDTLEKITDSYKIFNTYLEKSKYAAGDHLTVADLSLVATVSTAEATGFDITPYPNVVTWYQNLKKTIPGYEEANGTIEDYKAILDEFKNKVVAK